MRETITQLEQNLKNDVAGQHCDESTQLLAEALRTLNSSDNKKMKAMIAAIRAASHIIETVSKRYRQFR